ncbi:unnamed protein product [Closterium sp. NIES-54]
MLSEAGVLEADWESAEKWRVVEESDAIHAIWTRTHVAQVIVADVTGTGAVTVAGVPVSDVTAKPAAEEDSTKACSSTACQASWLEMLPPPPGAHNSTAAVHATYATHATHAAPATYSVLCSLDPSLYLLVFNHLQRKWVPAGPRLSSPSPPCPPLPRPSPHVLYPRGRGSHGGYCSTPPCPSMPPYPLVPPCSPVPPCAPTEPFNRALNARLPSYATIGAASSLAVRPNAAAAGSASAAAAAAAAATNSGNQNRSTAASALVVELVDFAARCRLDYAASLVAESESVCPPSVGGECALSTDVLEDRQEEFQCFAAALPHLVSTLISPEGDPDAPDILTPRSYAEAIEGPYSSQWQSAMDAEMASWKSTGTYVDEVPPPGANIVSGMRIFRVKRPPGSPPVFKARYVARGFSQRQGVDYFQTFSPTPKMTTLRVLLHVAAQRDYELHSLDFSTAFLQGSLHEEIWLRRPPGFTGSFPPGTQWSLRRPVYGLRQAPREWHDTLRTTLAALGFAPSTADPSLFLRTDTSLPPFYVLVYVDDLVFATTDTTGLAHVKSEVQKRHTCTDLGELRSYLGLQITQDRAQRTITLTQSHMVQQVLQRFDFTYSSPQATPLSTRHSLSALPLDESVEPSGPYPELVGCLMYLMTCTRPDLAYPLSILARYVAPGRHRPEHMVAAKRVLRYLCSTSGLGLVLGGRRPVVLTGHADASWADDQATQRSSQGYTFTLGSGSVLWRSTHSSSVLGSSCEAEIYAGAMAAQELRWLTYLLADLGEPPSSPVLYVDNKAMLALCREHKLEHRTKHIALRYFLARELQQRGQLRLAYVASEANTADIFTKALPPGDHQRFCTMLGFPTYTSTPLHAWLSPCERALPADAREILEAERLEPKGVKLQHALAVKVHGRRYAIQVQETRRMSLNPLSGHTQRMFSLTGYGTGDWLTALLIENTRRVAPEHFSNVVHFRLGLPFSTPAKCDCSYHTEITDPRLPNHLFRYGTGKHRINTHNELRDACITMAQDAGFIVHGESAASCPIEDQTADITMRDRSSGAVYICDVTITDPISTRDPNATKGRGRAAREMAEKKKRHYANRPDTVGFFPLAVDTYGCPCAEVPEFLKLLADTAAMRHFNALPHSFHAARFLHLFRQRWTVALQRAQSVGYLIKSSQAAVAENPPVGGVQSELHLGDCWHVALPILQQLVKKEMVAGICVKGEPDEVLGCPTCMQAKFTRFPFSSSEATAKAPLDEVVMDMVGPLKLGAAGAEYFLTIVEIYTRMTWVYVLSEKSDVAETMKIDLLPMVERQQDRLVKAIWTDRGGEFLSKEFGLWLKKNGIRHPLTMPYSPAMNGITKRANRTITETARGLLIEAGLPDYFWPDAASKHSWHKPSYCHRRGKRRIEASNWLTYEALGKPAQSALAAATMMVGDDEESEYEEFSFAVFSPVEMPREPATLKESLESSDAKEWKKAMESELKSIEENGMWELVELPEGHKAITSKWLFKIKSDADGKIERYKSRLVAKGYQQKEKVDDKELFAPVGFDDGSGRVWKLKKALYGLKQAPRQWYLKLREVLEEIGFTPSSADHSLFMLGGGEQRSFMVVYVDDILIFSPSSDLVKEVMLKLQDKFKCKALDDVNFYLGLHIERDVEKRCMRCVKGPEEESVGEEERRRFHSLVGSLMYAAVNTRPDVAFATGQLARVVQCPNEEQVAAGMRVAKYLGQTATVGLQYSAVAQRRQNGADGVEPGRLFLTALSDASHHSEPEDMTNVGGFIRCVGGGPTSWESKKQVNQALSSVESEYMALFRAVRETAW